MFLIGMIFRDQKGNGGYEVVPPTEILSFTSPENDATITFINSTTVNGLLLQHGQAFDIVASEDYLQVF